MNSEEISSNQRKSYMKISYEKRLRLIQLVKEEGKNMTNSAKLLKIKPSTARAIVKSFQETGKVFQAKKDHEKRILIEKYKQDHRNKKNLQNQNQNQVSFQPEPYYFMIPIQNIAYSEVPGPQYGVIYVQYYGEGTM